MGLFKTKEKIAGKDVEVLCKETEDGVGYCKVEEVDGDGWAEIKKVPDEKGELRTKEINYSPEGMDEIAKKAADKHLSSKSKSIIR